MIRKIMKNNFKILDEGYKPIAIILFISLILKFFVSDFLGNIAFIVVLFVIFIYRDTVREIFKNEENILSPIDGEISAIDIVDGKQVIYCSTSLIDAQTLLSPIDGKMEIKSYHKGLNLDANSFKGRQLNEQAVIKFLKKDGKTKSNLTLRLLGGTCNKEMLIDQNKDKISQGEKFGLFCEGQVLIQAMRGIKLSVNIGDKIIAGQTVIGKIKR